MERDLKDFNRIDPRLFKAFLAAAKWENFTVAAQKSAMTQSGVSQQVSKLETQIGTSLFKRINKSVSLTNTGKRLVKYIDRYLDEMDSFFEDVSVSEEKLIGKVSYAMPNSCLLSPHLGMMLEKKKSFPKIELDIQILPNDLVYKKVLKGEIDFGFVTDLSPNPAINFISFCQEEFVLVGSSVFKSNAFKKEDLMKYKFIDFPGMDVYFNKWWKAQFPKSKTFNHDFLDIVASISQLDGVITLLKGGVGVSILPKHCISEELKNKELFVLSKALPKKSVLNDIYIISLKENVLPKRCEKVLSWFLAMK